MTKGIHAFVYGTVQGVFFRSFVRSQANLKKITGWVRNLPDGGVEIVAEGDADRIDDFIELVRKGSTASKVENMEIENRKPGGNFRDFSIR